VALGAASGSVRRGGNYPGRVPPTSPTSEWVHPTPPIQAESMLTNGHQQALGAARHDRAGSPAHADGSPFLPLPNDVTRGPRRRAPPAAGVAEVSLGTTSSAVLPDVTQVLWKILPRKAHAPS